MMDRQIALEIWDTWKNRKSIKGFIQKVFTTNDRYIKEIFVDAMDGESYIMSEGSNPGEVCQYYIEDIGFYNNSLKISLDNSVSLMFKTK